MSLPFRFIHAADLHLGVAFKGVHRTAPEVGISLREATYGAFEGIIGLALEKNVDFVLFAGDIYNSNENSLRPQLTFRDGLNRLHEAGIASCVVHGNHDPLDGKTANLPWPASCRRFAATSGEPCIMRRGEYNLAAVCGISYGRREVTEKLAARYTHHHPHLFTIGLLHTNCGDGGTHANYAPSTVEELRSYPFDYWALGHIHSPQVLSQHSPAIVYAGSPQGLNPKETGPHGCYLVEVDADRAVHLDFVETCPVVWCAETLDGADWQTEGDAIDALESKLAELGEYAQGRSVLVRLELVGRTSLHHWLHHKPNQIDLLDRLRGAGNSVPFVWLDRLTVSTQPEVDYLARRSEQDVLGEILRQADAVRGTENLNQARVLIADLYKHRIAGKLLAEQRDVTAGDVIPTDVELAQWIERAAEMAVDRLLEGEAAA